MRVRLLLSCFPADVEVRADGTKVEAVSEPEVEVGRRAAIVLLEELDIVVV
jgi:hypothetical protein